MNESRLKQILDGFPELRIAVIGDFFLDKWLLIDRSIDEPSLETGLTAYQVAAKRICPGAAGTVTNNLSALDVGEIYAVGFAGDDGEGYELIQGLNRTRVRTDYLYQYEDVFTPTYIKPLFNYKPQPEEANRLDIRNRGITPAHIEEKVIASLYEVSKKVDAIIALDQVVEQNTGVITENLRKALADLGRTRPELIICADSRAHTADFRNVIVKCNHFEVMRAVDPDYIGDVNEEIIKNFTKSMAKITGRQVFVTWGQNGTIAVKGNETVLVSTLNVEGHIDICGAGDTATSGIVSALSCGASEEEAALIANLAASITIQQIGTTGTASRREIVQRFKKLHTGSN